MVSAVRVTMVTDVKKTVLIDVLMIMVRDKRIGMVSGL